MNKRKIDINELKKQASKGKKHRTVNVKYEVVLSYFKQKEPKDAIIFQVTFLPLINDLLEQLSSTEFILKLDKESKDPLKQLIITNTLKLQSFDLRGLSKQFPIQQICSCLYIDKKTGRRILDINKNKLMIFFKKLRLIYPDFCYCVGEKYVLDDSDMKNLYELFRTQWSKNEQKGRLDDIQKLERRLCRSLFFIGVIIENNIFEAIDQSERKQRQQQSEFGTKSQHKKNIKGVNQQVSTTHSFGSFDISNLSTRLKSQASQQEEIQKNKFIQYSQKSQKIVSKSRYDLWDKAQIKSLKFTLKGDNDQNPDFEVQKYEINYLSNDVENILIEQAFKIQKFKDSCERYQVNSPNQYYFVNYGNPAPYATMNHMFAPNMMPYNYFETNQQLYNNHVSNYNIYGNAQVNTTTTQLNQLKKSLGFLNLVQTRKKDRYE